MEKIERLKNLANKPASKWTAKDREYIVSLSADEGVYINTLCPDCYIDAAIILLNKLRGNDNPIVDGYQLRAGLDVWHAGMRVNSATLTAANAKKWIAAGLPLRFFTKTPKDADK